MLKVLVLTRLDIQQICHICVTEMPMRACWGLYLYACLMMFWTHSHARTYLHDLTCFFRVQEVYTLQFMVWTHMRFTVPNLNLGPLILRRYFSTFVFILSHVVSLILLEPLLCISKMHPSDWTLFRHLTPVNYIILSMEHKALWNRSNFQFPSWSNRGCESIWQLQDLVTKVQPDAIVVELLNTATITTKGCRCATMCALCLCTIFHWQIAIQLCLSSSSRTTQKSRYRDWDDRFVIEFDVDVARMPTRGAAILDYTW